MYGVLCEFRDLPPPQKKKENTHILTVLCLAPGPQSTTKNDILLTKYVKSMLCGRVSYLAIESPDLLDEATDIDLGDHGGSGAFQAVNRQHQGVPQLLACGTAPSLPGPGKNKNYCRLQIGDSLGSPLQSPNTTSSTCQVSFINKSPARRCTGRPLSSPLLE